MTPARYLRRSVLWLLIAKLAALAAIYFLFFSPAQRVRVDSQTVESHLFSPEAGSSGE